MKLFILENCQDRIKFFRQEFDDSNELTIVSDIRMAKTFLKQDDYDIMFLDHDLNDLKVTGYDVVKFITQNRVQLDSTIFIHSVNPVGSKRMYDELNDHGYKVALKPFTELIKMRKK